MPHALLLCFGKGNQESAWRAFDETVDEDVPLVMLCDTCSVRSMKSSVLPTRLMNRSSAFDSIRQLQTYRP